MLLLLFSGFPINPLYLDLLRSKLLISLDTSLVHIAAAQQTPIIAMYTNDESNYIRYAPFSERKKDIISNTSLIKDIDPHEVIHAVDKILFN